MVLFVFVIFTHYLLLGIRRGLHIFSTLLSSSLEIELKALVRHPSPSTIGKHLISFSVILRSYTLTCVNRSQYYTIIYEDPSSIFSDFDVTSIQFIFAVVIWLPSHIDEQTDKPRPWERLLTAIFTTINNNIRLIVNIHLLYYCVMIFIIWHFFRSLFTGAVFFLPISCLLLQLNY